ncbi:MAG TPA: T9SS type A sorting domain-containing protein [Bacteroidia bacterium]|nr:T9SS type A sorting domain-containing protein [Bacteroidia bacterium]
MKKYFFIWILLLVYSFANGQGRNSIWCFGDSAGIDFRNISAPSLFASGMNSIGSCSTISDTTGNLMFYCSSPDIVNFNNGVLPLGIVYNRNHLKMQNGDSLNCRAWYHEMVIVPDPDNSNLYYIFHVGVTNLYGLYYSVVDMSQDSGRGAVISKNTQLRNEIGGDYIQAVKHGNGKDWWVIFRTAPPSNNKFYVYSINSNGVQFDHIDSIGPLSSTNGGDLRFNSNGTQFAFCNWNGLLALYDFDRCTGTISLNEIIHQEFSAGTSPFFFDCCFSPNDSMLYVSSVPYYSTNDTSQIYIYQFRLWMPNVYASKLVIWSVPYPNFPGAVRLAPDNKIYIAAQSTGYPYDSTNYYTENMNLTVINQPNLVGALACDVQPFSFYLGGKRTYWGLPNNPTYDLGPLTGSLCDTINTIIEQPEIIHSALNLSYQSAWQSVIVNANNLKGIKIEIYLSDISGRILLADEGKIISGCFTRNISMDNLAVGVYLVTIVTDKEKLSGKIVKD